MNAKKYDSTVARIAGNILSGYVPLLDDGNVDRRLEVIRTAVAMARAIVAEVERTEPVQS